MTDIPDSPINTTMTREVFAEVACLCGAAIGWPCRMTPGSRATIHVERLRAWQVKVDD